VLSYPLKRWNLAQRQGAEARHVVIDQLTDDDHENREDETGDDHSRDGTDVRSVRGGRHSHRSDRCDPR
jgi:hypothetical protein